MFKANQMLNVLSLNRMNLFSEHCESHTDCKYGEICDSTHKFCKASKYYTDSQIICPPLSNYIFPIIIYFCFLFLFCRSWIPITYYTWFMCYQCWHRRHCPRTLSMPRIAFPDLQGHVRFWQKLQGLCNKWQWLFSGNNLYLPTWVCQIC